MGYPDGYCSTMPPDRCPACGGDVQPTVLSGIVSLKRTRSMMASGKVSAVDARTCTRCGRTELYARDPRRLFRDLLGEGKGKGKATGTAGRSAAPPE